MPISIDHKLGLLRDLLQNHVNEQHLSLREMEQIKQLANVLSADPSLDPALCETVGAIYQSFDQPTSQSIEKPLSTTNVEKWISDINLL
ncbi:YtzH-like family protein [Shouchella shacheensis]|uniref:YtzH-like family protein n=1 Tax=Shouchella shacheensis TaxID=1649580 RepID=UPI0007402AAC|nr:YtzH-like family protein [Shouchella shacheensis]